MSGRASLEVSRSHIRAVPLTYQQEWIWSLLNKNNTLEFLQRTYAWRLSGQLDTALLSASLDAVFGRHDSLRTTIRVTHAGPAQHVHEPCSGRMKLINCNSSDSDAETEADRTLHALSVRPVDLTSSSLVDVTVLKLASNEHLMVVTMHHMLTDLTSLSIVFRELWLSYGQLALGKNYFPPEVSLQYTDYAIWQRNTHRHWVERNRRYWADKLRGAIGLTWPVDGRMNVTRRNALGKQTISVGERLSAALFSLAQQEQTTPAMVVLACYTAALRHWCQRSTLVIPFNISGRDRAELANMIGPLGQMLFLKVSLTGEETFSELLKITTEEFQEAHDHLDFAKLSLESPELLKGGFLQWLAWNPAERAGMSAADWDGCGGGLRIRGVPPKRSLSNLSIEYDLVLQLFRTSEGIRGTWWYRADLFAATAVAGFSRDLLRVFERSVRDPTDRITS